MKPLDHNPNIQEALKKVKAALEEHEKSGNPLHINGIQYSPTGTKLLECLRELTKKRKWAKEARIIQQRKDIITVAKNEIQNILTE